MKNHRRTKAPAPKWHRDENSKNPLAGLHLFLSRSEKSAAGDKTSRCTVRVETR